MTYDLGAVVPLGATIRDASGALANAGSVSLTIGLPDGTSTTIGPIAPASTGQYAYDYLTAQAGRHTVRWVASGINSGSCTDVFDVRDQAPIAIVSLADARAQLGMGPSETADDDELRRYISGASLAVERALGTIVSRRSFTERRSADDYGQVLLSNVPVLAVSSAASADGTTTWTAADLEVDTASGLVAAKSGAPALRGVIDFVYAAGLRIVPADYYLATLIILQHLWETQRGTMGVQLGGDSEPWMPGRGFAIPRRALELLGLTLPGVA